MRFIASIHLRAACLAMISLDDEGRPSAQAVVDDARETLLRDIARGGSDDPTDGMSREFADAFAEFVELHLESRRGSLRTCIARLKNDGTRELDSFPGEHAFISVANDPIAYFRAMSDEEVESAKRLPDDVFSDDMEPAAGDYGEREGRG